jgi:hypothetical protein
MRGTGRQYPRRELLQLYFLEIHLKYTLFSLHATDYRLSIWPRYVFMSLVVRTQRIVERQKAPAHRERDVIFSDRNGSLTRRLFPKFLRKGVRQMIETPEISTAS